MPDELDGELARLEPIEMVLVKVKVKVRVGVDDFEMREVTCLKKKLYELRVII